MGCTDIHGVGKKELFFNPDLLYKKIRMIFSVVDLFFAV
jgi:hypothetical protein